MNDLEESGLAFFEVILKKGRAICGNGRYTHFLVLEEGHQTGGQKERMIGQ